MIRFELVGSHVLVSDTDISGVWWVILIYLGFGEWYWYIWSLVSDTDISGVWDWLRVAAISIDIRRIRAIELWRLSPGFIGDTNAPEKCVFTNHLPRLHLKVNSITKSRRASLYSVKVIKMSRVPIDRFFYSTVASRVVSLLRNNFSVLRRARCWKRTTPVHLKLLAFGVWTLSFTSDRNHANAPIVSLKISGHGRYRRRCT